MPVLMLLLGLIDELSGVFDVTLAGPVRLGSALLTAAALLLWPWLGARRLPVAAGISALVSLAVTAALPLMEARQREMDSVTPLENPYSLAEPAALLGLLALTAWRGRPVRAALAAAATITAIVMRPLVLGVDEGSLVVTFLFTLAATVALAAGLTARLVVADLQRRETAVRLEQRAEFARDLHDFVAHHVTGIVIQAQGARSVAVRRPDLVPPALERIEHAGAEALKSMRAMVGMLRQVDPQEPQAPDVALAPLAGMAEVRALVEEFAPVGGGRAALRTEGELGDLPVEVVTTVHRVVMEALTNIRKHARDFTEVEVRLVRSGPRVTVTVSDDGRPHAGHRAPQSLGGGFGLKGLAERVGLAGGRVEAGPAEGGGWRIEVTLPVDGGAAARGTTGRAVGSEA
ncbi:histidine kinase [Streptomyces sp. MUM 136J]|uniref:sensor histidine kinase n=1 Tax=Streptomyces sp. MUM 136J TaxID=2791992 RepID=UPI001F033930|nr:histidine kinase [Streptomyces sp. MUM 136J]MCH0568417.1 histidine kinase [Streptomyces sp. MUM 136J]